MRIYCTYVVYNDILTFLINPYKLLDVSQWSVSPPSATPLPLLSLSLAFSRSRSPLLTGSYRRLPWSCKTHSQDDKAHRIPRPLQRKSVPWSLEHDFPSVYPAILIFHNHRCEPSKFVSSCSILINKCALSCSIHYSGRKEEMRWGYKRSQCSRHMYMVDMAFEYTSSFRLARVPNSQISLKATFTRHRSHPTLRLGSS